MRKKQIVVYEANLLGAIAYQLYEFAPNHQPRKIETIMNKMSAIFRKTEPVYNFQESYYTLINPENITKNISKYLYKTLYTIPEFKELNLSQNEFEKGVSVGDENRPKFSFVSMYIGNTKESLKNDFIDLDAFISGVARFYDYCTNYYKDCFGCIHQDHTSGTLSSGTDDACILCSINPNRKNNLEYSLSDFNKNDDSHIKCIYNCPHLYCICCDSCDKNTECDERCDAVSSTCGNKYPKTEEGSNNDNN